MIFVAIKHIRRFFIVDFARSFLIFFWNAGSFNHVTWFIFIYMWFWQLLFNLICNFDISFLDLISVVIISVWIDFFFMKYLWSFCSDNSLRLFIFNRESLNYKEEVRILSCWSDLFRLFHLKTFCCKFCKKFWVSSQITNVWNLLF